jgi:hypothetical protein
VTTSCADEFVGGATHEQMKVLGRSWHLHDPSVIAEVPLQFAFDRAAGECCERHTEVGIEAIDSLHQPQHRHLPQIVVGRAWFAVALGNVGGKAHVPLDQAIARRPTARRHELSEQVEIVEITPVVGITGIRGGLGHRRSRYPARKCLVTRRIASTDAGRGT